VTTITWFLEDNLARQSRDHINIRNTFYIKYCKKTFLTYDFCNFWAQFDVNDSSHVVLEHYLRIRSRDNSQNKRHNLKNKLCLGNYKKTVPNCDFYNFWAQFNSFDVNDSCHVILEHYLGRQSRDNSQNNCHKFQNHVLFQKLLEKCFGPWFL